jgi:hypothetical protein
MTSRKGARQACPRREENALGVVLPHAALRGDHISVEVCIIEERGERGKVLNKE